jgi:hypothetical protein
MVYTPEFLHFCILMPDLFGICLIMIHGPNMGLTSSTTGTERYNDRNGKIQTGDFE